MMHRFTGPNSHDVLRQVRETLGDDAMILANRMVGGGIEVIAMVEQQVDALTVAGAAQPAVTAPAVAAVAAAPVPEAAPAASAPVEAQAPATPDTGIEATTRTRFPFAAFRARFLRGGAASGNAGKPVSQAADTSTDAQTAPTTSSLTTASTAVSIEATATPAAANAADAAPTTLAAESVTRLFADAAARFEARRAGNVASDAGSSVSAMADAATVGASGAQGTAVRTAPVSASAPQQVSPAAQPPVQAAVPVASQPIIVDATPAGHPARATSGGAPAAVTEPQAGAAEQRMMAELQALRAMLHDQTAGLASLGIKLRDPVRARMFQTMLNAGFSAQLTRYLLDNLPETDSFDTAQDFLQRAIELNLTTLDQDNALLDKGGIFALMGPTGVGKTTTTAKLAARFVLRHGASRVALLTTDSYRIGGHEQLRIYGRILGVSVHSVRDGEDLTLALADLRDKHVVLIDTIGMSQRDRALSEQIAMLHSAGHAIQRLLLLNTTSNGRTLDEVVHAYRDADLAGCILTKIDEAATLGHALDVLVRHKLPLHYVSCGQRVPEDIAVANRKLLVHRAFREAPGPSPFALEEDESYLLTHGAAAARPEADMALPA